jgi:proteasome maturation protein
MSGVHDTFRYGLKKASTSVEAGNSHPLQARLEQVSVCRPGALCWRDRMKGLIIWCTQWEATQAQLKLNMQRNVYGLGLPLRNMMDRKICAEVRLIGNGGQRSTEADLLKRHSFWCDQDKHHPALSASSTTLGGSSNIALEILEGKDESIDVGDFMGLRECSKPIHVLSSFTGG